MINTKFKQSRFYRHLSRVGDFFPAIFFFGGFLWDALTIGQNVAPLDLYIFGAYLSVAALILYVIGRPSYVEADASHLSSSLGKLRSRVRESRIHWPQFPYFLLQFIYGNLLSSLFILYFKSASHWLAWLMCLLLT